MIENLKVYLKLKLVRFIIVGVVAGFGMGHTVEDPFQLKTLALLKCARKHHFCKAEMH